MRVDEKVRYTYGMSDSEIVLVVVGAVLGFLVAQGNEYLRLRREEKRAIGRALKTLLLVRRYLYALKLAREMLTKHLTPPAQQMAQALNLTHTFMPNPTGLLGKYEEAIDIVSGIKPLLGAKLARKTELLPFVIRYTQMATQIAAQNEQASTLWLMMDKHIIDLYKLDDLILELAELHAIETHDEVRRHIEEPVIPPFDIQNFFTEIGKAIQKPDLPQK